MSISLFKHWKVCSTKYNSRLCKNFGDLLMKLQRMIYVSGKLNLNKIKNVSNDLVCKIYE